MPKQESAYRKRYGQQFQLDSSNRQNNKVYYSDFMHETGLRQLNLNQLVFKLLKYSTIFKTQLLISLSDKWRYLDNYDCFIDDRKKTAIDLAKRGKTVFMPKREYNNFIPEDFDGSYSVVTRAEWVRSDNFKLLNDGRLILLSGTSELITGRFDDLIFR